MIVELKKRDVKKAKKRHTINETDSESHEAKRETDSESSVGSQLVLKTGSQKEKKTNRDSNNGKNAEHAKHQTTVNNSKKRERTESNEGFDDQKRPRLDSGSSTGGNNRKCLAGENGHKKDNKPEINSSNSKHAANDHANKSCNKVSKIGVDDSTECQPGEAEKESKISGMVENKRVDVTTGQSNSEGLELHDQNINVAKHANNRLSLNRSLKAKVISSPLKVKSSPLSPIVLDEDNQESPEESDKDSFNISEVPRRLFIEPTNNDINKCGNAITKFNNKFKEVSDSASVSESKQLDSGKQCEERCDPVDDKANNEANEVEEVPENKGLKCVTVLVPVNEERLPDDRPEQLPVNQPELEDKNKSKPPLDECEPDTFEGTPVSSGVQHKPEGQGLPQDKFNSENDEVLVIPMNELEPAATHVPEVPDNVPDGCNDVQPVSDDAQLGSDGLPELPDEIPEMSDDLQSVDQMPIDPCDNDVEALPTDQCKPGADQVKVTKRQIELTDKEKPVDPTRPEEFELEELPSVSTVDSHEQGNP